MGTGGTAMKLPGLAGGEDTIVVAALWLDDRHEQQRERRLLDALLHRALDAVSGDAQSLQALPLALQLLAVLPRIGRSLLGSGLSQAAGEHLRLLVEELETCEPENPLYLAVITQLRQWLDVQARLHAAPPEPLVAASRHEAPPFTAAQQALLQRRQHLLQQSEQLLLAHD